MLNEKIKDLQRQIEREQEKIKSCSHIFEKPYYDAEEYQDSYDTGNWLGGGVDRYPEYGYRTKTRNRWARKCLKCGKIEYTYHKKPIIVDYEPDFK